MPLTICLGNCFYANAISKELCSPFLFPLKKKREKENEDELAKIVFPIKEPNEVMCWFRKYITVIYHHKNWIKWY